jgi:hypothetical protein
LEDEPDAIGHGEFLRAMPARPVNLKHDARKAVGRLDDDCTHTVAGDALEHGGETWPGIDWVCTAHALIRSHRQSHSRRAFAKALIAARWRLSLSLSSPTLALELVRK